jgi:hypothetical protein
LTAEPPPGPADVQRREIAVQLQRDHPNWLVLWGSFTHEYVAFPRFKTAPGTVLHNKDPDRLANRMRQIELMKIHEMHWEGNANV